jgi:hypothetical protein
MTKLIYKHWRTVYLMVVILALVLAVGAPESLGGG